MRSAAEGTTRDALARLTGQGITTAYARAQIA